MKKLFFFMACVAMSVLSMAQVNQLVWANGRLLYGSPITNVDSLTYDESAGMDTLLLPRVLIKEVHDTVYVTQVVHDTVYVETDCGEDIPSAGIGAFSIADGKQVTFSKGNLQYHPKNNEWRFAENQTDYIGDANSNIAADYDGWIDLFGWGTGDAPTKSSTSYSDYSTFVDWGTNQIGADAPNTWRTLSKDEWMYIFYNRPNAQSLFALGSVNGVNGTIILPDNWTTPSGVSFVASTTLGLSWDGSSYYNSNGNNFSHNTYTAEQWQTMEQAGAVFLPASGYRWGSVLNYVGNFGYYWSSTEDYVDFAHYVYFTSDGFLPQYNLDRHSGRAVRLAQDL